MADVITRKAEILCVLLQKKYKESGVDKEIHKILGDREWHLTATEIELALRKLDNPAYVVEKQFEKLAQLIGCSKEDARLIGLRARYQIDNDIDV